MAIYVACEWRNDSQIDVSKYVLREYVCTFVHTETLPEFQKLPTHPVTEIGAKAMETHCMHVCKDMNL